MTGHGTEHIATFTEREDGTFDGGCDICGVRWYGETEQGWADAWCTGHNSAVHRIASRPVPLWFPPVGPGDAITLSGLRDLIDEVIERLGKLPGDLAGIGDAAEIVQPAAYPPLLFVWTPPSVEGWHRDRLGAIYIEKRGAFIPEPDHEA